MALAPGLSEAKVNLALALVCQHEDEDETANWRKGQIPQKADSFRQAAAKSSPYPNDVNSRHPIPGPTN